MNTDMITPARWLRMKSHEKQAAWRSISHDMTKVKALIRVGLAADKLERDLEIQARKKRGPTPAPDYQKAKALLIAKITEMEGGKTPPYEAMNEGILAACLDEALDSDPTTDGGPTTMTGQGECLLGSTDDDWAEMALWVYLSPVDEEERAS